MSATEAALNGLLDEIRNEGVQDEHVLSAMRKVDRALFVPADSRELAYANTPLLIGQGQTISQPLVVGLMTQALDVRPDSKVMEVGTGSGYQTAVLAELASEVISVERHAPLAERARELLARLGYSNVRVHTASGSTGWPSDAPYDRILVTAGAPRIPVHLVARLKSGGRLVVPVGPRASQQLIVLDKTAGGLQERVLGEVRFVPLVGDGAWQEDNGE